MIVTVVNIKGGCGKTTSAIALASAASLDGKESLVLDADPQGSATEWAMIAAENGDDLPFDVETANIASIKRLKNEDKWIFIDCPPSGAVTDEAVSIADLVVVPTSPAPADLSKTWETVDALESQGKVHGVLLTKVQTNTLTLRSALAEIEETGASCFETQIPKREAIISFFGQSFGEELYGYEEAFKEIEEALDGNQ